MTSNSPSYLLIQSTQVEVEMTILFHACPGPWNNVPFGSRTLREVLEFDVLHHLETLAKGRINGANDKGMSKVALGGPLVAAPRR